VHHKYLIKNHLFCEECGVQELDVEAIGVAISTEHGKKKKIRGRVAEPTAKTLVQ